MLPSRNDFTFPTSNKQFCFFQHCYRGLPTGGRAATVLAENGLFESGIGRQIRACLLDTRNLHAIQRFRTSIVYARGIKTNALLFTRSKTDKCNTYGVRVDEIRARTPQFDKRSEYQYFEFQAIDRPLGADEMDELRRWSSRAEITPTSFWNEYQWGDFKGDPRRWMERYFDAFLHVANWGTHWLMLRLPRELMDLDDVAEYLLEDGIEGWRTAEHVVLSFRSETEEPEWEEGRGRLASLIGARAGLMRGDRRSLYLGWLAQARAGFVDETSPEPPVPPGLGELDATQRALADFLRVPSDLVAAAAESSTPLQASGMGSADIARWVAERPGAEKDALLVELLADEGTHRLAVLRQRVERELNPVDPGDDSGARRTVGELLGRGDVITRERQAREAAARAAELARQAAEAAGARKRYLASLRGREEELWSKVYDLVSHSRASTYKEAVDRLKDLRDLADTGGSLDAFAARVRRLREQQARKPALIRRLDEAGLIG